MLVFLLLGGLGLGLGVVVVVDQVETVPREIVRVVIERRLIVALVVRLDRVPSVPVAVQRRRVVERPLTPLWWGADG